MAQVTQLINIIVKAINRAPVWTPPAAPIEFTSGTAKRVKIDSPTFVTDPDGDPLVVTLVNLSASLQAAGFSFDAATEEIVFDGRNIGSTDVTGSATFSANDGRL